MRICLGNNDLLVDAELFHSSGVLLQIRVITLSVLPFGFFESQRVWYLADIRPIKAKHRLRVLHQLIFKAMARHTRVFLTIWGNDRIFRASILIIAQHRKQVSVLVWGIRHLKEVWEPWTVSSDMILSGKLEFSFFEFFCECLCNKGGIPFLKWARSCLLASLSRVFS